MLKKLRSIKVIDVLRALSIFDLTLVLLIIIVPVAVIAAKGGKPGSGKPAKDDTTTVESPVKIDNITPSEGPEGTVITITGTGFDTTNNNILLKGKTIVSGIASADGTSITFALPSDVPCKPPKACPVKMEVTNSQGQSNAFPFKITFGTTDPIEELIIVTESLPVGTKGVPYETTLEGAGGTLPYTWGLYSGYLPHNIRIDPITGKLSGTPSVDGTFPVTYKLEDSDKGSVTKQLNLVIEQPTLDFDSVTIHGRFIDYFTNEPIGGVDIKKTASSQDATIQVDSTSGEFTIQTTISELISKTSGVKGFVYYPPCYFYAQSINIFKYTDGRLTVESNEFDLTRGDPSDIHEITSSTIELGDVTVWPATRITMYFDQELSPWIEYPEEGKSVGNVNYMMNTVGYLGGNIIPFNYPLTVKLKDRDGNVYEAPSYTHDREHGCNVPVILNYFNGEFTWEVGSSSFVN